MPTLPHGPHAFAYVALAAGLVTAGIVGNQADAAPLASVQPATTTAATTTGDIYVDNSSYANCSDTGSASGSESQPFCTISAAEGVVQPGQTVVVEPGIYAATTISVSGTPGHPVTFLGATTGVAAVDGSKTASAFLVSGVHDVVITGFNAIPGGAPAYEVSGQSSDITINGGRTYSSLGVPAVQVDAASGVTISRGSFEAGTAIQVNSGASGVDVAGNTIIGIGHYPAIAVSDAPGTDVAGNTVLTNCGPGIALTGASAGAAIENNIVEAQGLSVTSACTTPGVATQISVSAGSVSGTTAGYNLFDPVGGVLYDWNGTGYTSLADFTSATGQGAHDLAEAPGLSYQENRTTVGYGSSISYPPTADSPAIDSANADAPGELATDQLGNPRADDPGVRNTGVGTGTGTSTSYFDRGAVEVEGPVAMGGVSVVPSGPLTVTAKQQATTTWQTNGPIGTYVYNFGDSPFPVITTATSVSHTYQAAGPKTVYFEQAYGGGGLYTTTAHTAVGTGYIPLSPVRILDTRNGIGAPEKAVPAGGTLTLSVAGTAGVPAGASAVVMNVLVTQTASAGYVTVFPGTGTPPRVSNLDFSKGKIGTNLVTVQVADGKVSFHNGSDGTVQLVADLEGYYGAGGYGFQPNSPVRVLDTRNGTGAAQRPLPEGSRIQLNLAGKVPAGTTAAVLNVTVTGPQRDGWLAVYPDAASVPRTSNLNFVRNQTVADLVIVPLTNGIADLYNGSGGTVQVFADLQGYFATGAPDSFVPYGPVRMADTRTAGSSGIAKGSAVVVGTDVYSGSKAVAAVDNVTAAQPTGQGYLTVYPGGTARPYASNVDFTPGVTVPNLAMTPLSAGIAVYNGSTGAVQMFADEYGYFIANG